MNTSEHKKMKASDFDDAFEQSDVTAHLDLKSVKARYPVKRISIDFPKNILDDLDIEAAKIGVTRTSLIKMWISEHLSKRAA